MYLLLRGANSGHYQLSTTMQAAQHPWQSAPPLSGQCPAAACWLQPPPGENQRASNGSQVVRQVGHLYRISNSMI
jgi:hypothetical protein